MVSVYRLRGEVDALLCSLCSIVLAPTDVVEYSIVVPCWRSECVATNSFFLSKSTAEVQRVSRRIHTSYVAFSNALIGFIIVIFLPTTIRRSFCSGWLNSLIQFLWALIAAWCLILFWRYAAGFYNSWAEIFFSTVDSFFFLTLLRIFY